MHKFAIFPNNKNKRTVMILDLHYFTQILLKIWGIKQAVAVIQLHIIRSCQETDVQKIPGWLPA